MPAHTPSAAELAARLSAMGTLGMQQPTASLPPTGPPLQLLLLSTSFPLAIFSSVNLPSWALFRGDVHTRGMCGHALRFVVSHQVPPSAAKQAQQARMGRYSTQQRRRERPRRWRRRRLRTSPLGTSKRRVSWRRACCCRACRRLGPPRAKCWPPMTLRCLAVSCIYSWHRCHQVMHAKVCFY